MTIPTARPLAAIALAVAVALPAATPAAAQQGPAPERMAQCFGVYHLARAEAEDDAADFDNRLYRAGWSLPGEQRLAIAAEAGAMTAPDGLAGQVAACDAELQVTPQMTAPTPFGHEECGVRYSALAFSFTGPEQRRYFAEKGRLAVATQAIADGQEGVDPAYVDAVEAKGRQRARDHFTGDDTPDHAVLAGAFEAARACDAKYGVPVTPIPDEVVQAAAD